MLSLYIYSHHEIARLEFSFEPLVFGRVAFKSLENEREV